MKQKLASNLILRIDDELKNRLSRFQKHTGYSLSEVVRQSLNSLMDYYDKNNSISLPVVTFPKKDCIKVTENSDVVENTI